MGLFDFFLKKNNDDTADIPVSQAVDPRSLSSTKQDKDLKALMSFEEKINNSTQTLTEEDGTTKQIDLGLSLQNPFLGI